jgi:acyl carrier protein
MPFSTEQRAEFLSGLAQAFSEQLKGFNFETNLRAAGALDSLGILMLISFVDEKYGRTLAADDLAKVNTAEDILRLLEK